MQDFLAAVAPASSILALKEQQAGTEAFLHSAADEIVKLLSGGEAPRRQLNYNTAKCADAGAIMAGEETWVDIGAAETLPLGRCNGFRSRMSPLAVRAAA